MLLSDLNDLSITQVYYKYRNYINPLEIIQVTPDLLGRLDILITQYFGPYFELDNDSNDFVDVFPFYQILLDFNGIMDITDIQIGDVIVIPDLVTMVEYLERNEVFEKDEVAGVNTIYQTSKRPDGLIANGVGITTTTTAVPKLGVKQTSVSFDSKTGKIIF